MNISYQPREDRLLLKISTDDMQEYRIWLTRRFSGLLLKVLSEQLNEKGGTQKVMSDPQTRERLQQANTSQEYVSTPEMTYPLGEDGILAFKINAAKPKEGGLSLQLLPEEGEGINFTVDESMLYMLHNLLERCIFNTDWNLPSGELLPSNLH